MRVLLPLALLAVSSGCATTSAEKLPFADAFSAHRSEPPAAAVRARPQVSSRAPLEATKSPEAAKIPEAAESLELQAALIRFGSRAREIRSATPAGAAMPPDAQHNWEGLLGVLDAFLDRSAAATPSTDVVRARATADAELELDARAYGDFPPELADRVLERITRLGVRMAEVRRLGVVPARAKASLEWPIEPVLVTSLYGRRFHPIAKAWRRHLGVDLEAYSGQLVSAAGKGTVVKAGWVGGHGRMVEIRHPGGVVTRYSHLATTLVEEGTVVGKGDPVGLAGQSGRTTGPHLHFELWKNGRPKDPLEEIPSRPAALARDVPRS